MSGLTRGILTGLEIASVLLLSGIAAKAETERHKTTVKLFDTEIKLAATEISNILKDAKIRTLEKKLKQFQNDEES